MFSSSFLPFYCYFSSYYYYYYYVFFFVLLFFLVLGVLLVSSFIFPSFWVLFSSYSLMFISVLIFSSSS